MNTINKDKMLPKVSIIIPVYNVEKFLDRCMQSVLKQTLKEIEIILVDDGSPDNCPAMCDEYAQKDARVKVIHKKNAGLGYARNSGIEVATGEFVAFVDSDDFVDKRMYKRLYATAKNKDLDTCFCGFCRHYTTGKLDCKVEVSEDSYFISRKEVDSFLLDMVAPLPSYHSDVKYMMSACKALYKKALLNHYKIRFCSERVFVSEDLLFHLDYLPRAERVGFISEHLYYYCVNGTVSLTNTYSRAKFEKNKIFLDEVKHKLSLLFPENVYMNRYYRLCFLYLRVSLHQELHSKNIREKASKRRIVKELAGDLYFQDLFTQYPYTKLPWKHRLFFAMLKHKCYNLVSLLL